MSSLARDIWGTSDDAGISVAGTVVRATATGATDGSTAAARDKVLVPSRLILTSFGL
jgi:hypothetical protein